MIEFKPVPPSYFWKLYKCGYNMRWLGVEFRSRAAYRAELAAIEKAMR